MIISRSILAGLFFLIVQTGASAAGPAQAAVKKMEHFTIYRDEAFYACFPSVVRRPDGQLLVAFRRAPERRKLGNAGPTHTDPNSYLVLVRSNDSGKTWSNTPELMFAHPFGGSQDPSMVQLSDKSILCTSYGWTWKPPEALLKLKQPVSAQSGFAFVGGFLIRSKDGGQTWQGPIIPPHVETDPKLDIFGKPLPAFNRGALCEGADGRLFWVVASHVASPPARTETHLLLSEDKGSTWKYSCPVAQDPKIIFNETSIYETPKGDLVAFLRTGGFDDHLCTARSTDRGKSFQKWEDAGFQGNPFYALRLPDRRVLLVYGYRHKPFGIRARVLNAECTDVATSSEIVLRDDGGTVDLGYPWATMISKKRVLVVYYFNQNDGPRGIEGTFIDLD